MHTRWDIAEDGNCHVQCHFCNMKHEDDAEPYILWYVVNFGQEAYDALLLKHNTVVHWMNHELEEILCMFREKLKEQEE